MVRMACLPPKGYAKPFCICKHDRALQRFAREADFYLRHRHLQGVLVPRLRAVGILNEGHTGCLVLEDAGAL